MKDLVDPAAQISTQENAKYGYSVALTAGELRSMEQKPVKKASFYLNDKYIGEIGSEAQTRSDGQ